MASEPADEGFHDEVKTLTICIFGNHETAELAAANLTAHGIECWVSADDCGGMYPNLTAAAGVRLLVRASDAESAVALLNAQASTAEINQIEIEAVASAPPETVPPKKLVWGQIVAGIVVGIILCLFFQWANKLGTRTHYNYGRNGRPDEARIYKNGYLMEFRQDRNHDGEWDYRSYYDGYGNRIRSEYDNSFDGKPDVFYTYSNKELVSMERDTDFNGTSDEFCTYKNDILLQVDMKPNGAKYTTVREIFKNGVLTEEWSGGDSDGNFKAVVGYDPFFNPISTNNPTMFKLLLPSLK